MGLRWSPHFDRREDMKAVRLKAYQEHASYRTPYSFENIETYPLPPYSSILGIVHNVLGAERTIPGLRVSVQGRFGGIIRNYSRYWKHSKKEVKPYPIVVSELHDVELVIHVGSEDEALLKSIGRGLVDPPTFLYLGRPEDFLYVQEVKVVEVVENPLGTVKMELDAYVPVNQAEELGFRGVLYRVEEYYTKGRIGKQVRREFERIPVDYVQGWGEEVVGPISVDEEGYPVWWSRMPR